MDFEIQLSRAEKGTALVVLFLAAAGFFLLFSLGKLELLPATVFTLFTAALAFLAYHFTRARFRLDLFEKRWEVYENTWKFCSIALQEGKLRSRGENVDRVKQALEAADGSFRGKGHHRYRLLFGSDIGKVMDELNRIYARLISLGDNWEASWLGDMEYLEKTVNNLPEIFAPYLYFGNYRR